MCASRYVTVSLTTKKGCNCSERPAPASGAGHKVIATGGISESLDFAPDFFDVVDKNLTLKGLFLAGELQAGRIAAKN